MQRTYNLRPIPNRHQAPKKHRRGFIVCILILLAISIAGTYVAYALLRPLPAPKSVILPPVLPAQVKVNIPWPADSEAAFGADGYGLLASHNEQKPRPTASVAKVITALAVLQKRPLKLNEAGAAIPITQRDVDIYNRYVSQDGSAVPVSAGETISEYQALQAMLLPSANNIADTTAIWAFGSMDAYISYASSMVKALDMTATTVTDASGFSPSTVSTASDLIRLGDAALSNPVLAQIVNQSQATFPDYGTIENVNTLLGRAGIRGIKTGNTEQAGGCYLAAADVEIGGKKVTVLTAIMGSPTLGTAMRDSVPIIQSAVSQFQEVHVVRAGQSVGHITTAWHSDSEVITDVNLSVTAWSGTALSPVVTSGNIYLPAEPGSRAGSLRLSYAGTDYISTLHTKSAIRGPTATWRLMHPF